MFAPIILGSDKTTVSVATGQNEFWPLYMSLGNLHNRVRRARGDSVVLIGFLSIPKSKLVYLLVHTANRWIFSRQRARWIRAVPQFQAASVPRISHWNIFIARTCHVKAGGSTLPRWAFSACHIRHGPVHRGLPWTSPPRLYCSELVRKVRSSIWFYQSILLNIEKGVRQIGNISMKTNAPYVEQKSILKQS